MSGGWRAPSRGNSAGLRRRLPLARIAPPAPITRWHGRRIQEFAPIAAPRAGYVAARYAEGLGRAR